MFEQDIQVCSSIWGTIPVKNIVLAKTLEISALFHYKMRTPDSSHFLFLLKGHQFLLRLHKLGQYRFAGKQPRI